MTKATRHEYYKELEEAFQKDFDKKYKQLQDICNDLDPSGDLDKKIKAKLQRAIKIADAMYEHMLLYGVVTQEDQKRIEDDL